MKENNEKRNSGSGANSMKQTSRLRELIKKPGIIVMPGSFSAMSAKLVEDAGFGAVYMSGGCTSMSFIGWADVGLITFDEMLLNLRLIAVNRGGSSAPNTNDER